MEAMAARKTMDAMAAGKRRPGKWLATTAACLSFLCCSGTEETAVRQDFQVELYSYGGFSGTAEGVTVTGDGWAKLWRGRTATIRNTVDSLIVTRLELERIKALADSCEASTIRYQSRGDLTTVLAIRHKGRFHTISFAGEQIPDESPRPIRELIILLRTLRATNAKEGR